ncbi:MAG: cytochrome C [Gammaproteobacteria bacterium]
MFARTALLWFLSAVATLSLNAVFSLALMLPAGAALAASDEKPVDLIPNSRCLRCHGDPDDKTYERDDGTIVNIFIEAERYEQSVHAQQNCVDCHTGIKKARHRRPLPVVVGCVACHKKHWEEQQQNKEPHHDRLDVVLAEIDGYMNSVHARPNLLDQSRTNATCYDCHDAHTVGVPGSEARAEFRQRNPEICGRCHAAEKDEYMNSVHGRKHQATADATVDGDGAQLAGSPGGLIAQAAAAESHRQNGEGPIPPAVCSDCHTPHNIDRTDQDPVKLAITDQCGDCHEQQVRTYMGSYHSRVVAAGYAYTATCYDCHGGHGVQESTDPGSKIHPDNRLATCRECHTNAPENFVGFHAHGDPGDFENYPEMWIAQRLMQVLIIGVFVFFWVHMLLWMFRESRDLKEGKIRRPDPADSEEVYIRRFSLGWRITHLVFATSIMALVVTGMAVLFAEQGWAQWVIHLIGGPKVAAVVHRVAAVVLGIAFFGHLIAATWKIRRAKGQFRWLGPTSMIPTWQDIKDIGRMFKWFLGFAPRPDFDRWGYWEKFDYWAPFWGMAIIGISGVMLWFPNQTAAVFPGWVFNVATIVHAEEAVLATVFLFTVHFFNVHFRPSKFPMDIVMVTGAVPLSEFKQEHRLDYERLKASGELDHYLVKPPSERATRIGRKVTGWLIVIGLILAGFVLAGYFGHLAGN